MTVAPSKPVALAKPAQVRAPASEARLLGLGTAVPEFICTQDEIARRMADLWRLQGAALSKWRRIVDGAGIQTRHGVLPPDEVVGLSTAQRMIEYERFAPALGANAAQRALANAGVRPGEITDLIVVSCTGFAAPGVDAALVDRLALNPTVRRTTIGFMGCFGAIIGLRTAVGACAANPGSVTLAVCVELCSLHMRAIGDVQNQVASALFADGAAAAVVKRVGCQITDESPIVDRQSRTLPIGCLTTGASLLLKEGREWMTWRITDAGFAMTLTREVPMALRDCLDDFVLNSAPSRPRTFIVHPGGPGILDAVETALHLHPDALQSSRAILKRCGNMSSATVLFVLEEALRRGECELPALLLAFGPGLTIESLQLHPASFPDRT